MKKDTKAVEQENFLYFRAESKEEVLDYFKGYKITTCIKVENGLFKIRWVP